MAGEHWTENVAPGGEHGDPPGTLGSEGHPVPGRSAPASRAAAQARPRSGSERSTGTVYEP